MKVKDRTERKVPTGRPKISEATKKAVVELYNEDYAIADIIDACKISRTSVFRILRERRKEERQDG